MNLNLAALDLQSGTFWIMAAIWFTVPIMSWLWGVVTFPLYRKIVTLTKDLAQNLEQIKGMREGAENSIKESLALRAKIEEELKEVSTYYEKINKLIIDHTHGDVKKV